MAGTAAGDDHATDGDATVPGEGVPGSSAGPLAPQYAPRPRWVSALLVLAAVVVVVLLVALVSGTGHGPGRHLGLRG